MLISFLQSSSVYSSFTISFSLLLTVIYPFSSASCIFSILFLASSNTVSILVVALQAITALTTVPAIPATIMISGLCFFICNPILFIVLVIFAFITIYSPFLCFRLKISHDLLDVINTT